MKDQFALLIAGIVCAGAAWAFWRYFGAEAANMLGIVFMLCLALENRRLRQKLRECANQAPESPRQSQHRGLALRA